MSEEDVAAVTTLHVVNYDKSRNFDGISKLKLAKKDRHNKTLDEFSKFVDETNEVIVQETLQLSRDIRETLEIVDEEIEKFYKTLDTDSFLIKQSEDSLFSLREDLENIVQRRANYVEQYADGLENTEKKRAELTSLELKQLVDKLVAIAHRLPNDIEHIVEAEAFELNTEIINNTAKNAKTIGSLRIAQVTVEATGLQNWENAKTKWRRLRHEKALSDFEINVDSTEFTDPADRAAFMLLVRRRQDSRRAEIQEDLNVLGAMTASTISSEAVAEVQRDLARIGETEVAAIQECYNGMQSLRESLRERTNYRVESLRMELHEYGHLKLEPDRKSTAKKIANALQEESLAELWRLGGGLKAEFQSLSDDLCNDEMIYEHLVSSVLERLRLIECSFGLKAILEERGRLAQVDKVRGLITKMRSAARSEVPNVLRSIVPDLESAQEVDSLPELFRCSVQTVLDEMNKELASLESKLASSGTSFEDVNSRATGKSSLTRKSAKSNTSGRSRKSDKDKEATLKAPHIDPMQVKTWYQQLGILYFGSDIPQEYQDACVQGIADAEEQRECNKLVDGVIGSVSDQRVRLLDWNHKKLSESITNFLEAQASALSQTSSNVADYYHMIALLAETERALQKSLDDKSEDDIWDLKEEFRFECEDREALYEAACQRIRESTKQEELQENFQGVLDVLEGIQESYRTYHSNACFKTDKYPLVLVDSYVRLLCQFSEKFFIQPQPTHPLLAEYISIYDSTQRFNKRIFEADPDAAGVGEKRAIEDFYNVNLQNDDTLPEYESPLVAEEERARVRGEERDGEGGDREEEEEGARGVSAYIGRYKQVSQPAAIWERFTQESAFSPPEKDADIAAAAPPTGSRGEGGGNAEADATNAPEGAEIADAAGEGGTGTDGDGLATVVVPKRRTKPDTPWMALESDVSRKSEEEVAVLDDEEKETYELALSKAFVPMEEEQLAELAPEQRQEYERVRDLTAAIKQKRKEEAEPSHVLSHPPLRSNGDPWVQILSVSPEDISRVFFSIRDSFVATLEKEAFLRITHARELGRKRKAEYTDRLEDQIRNHWPRRGRVETQIKQPREAELLGHKEKTWRHIQTIQERMIAAQDKFSYEVQSGQRACDEYVNEMTSLRNSLSGDNFKNLAALQGVDVRARGSSLSFQAASKDRVQGLRQIAGPETEAVALFANSFRKICPLQAPGVEGGYSESEIDEIAALVQAQCTEIDSVSAAWGVQIAELEEQQAQCLRCQEEFTAKYEKVTHDLAMSEGLGQKYGAPRRRAQERIRTELSRDEQNAGQLDELLATLEFICAEELLALERFGSAEASVAASSIGQLVSKGPEVSDGEEVRPEVEFLKTAQNAWDLLRQIRVALSRRAAYLRVESDAPELCELPWMARERFETLTGQSGGGNQQIEKEDDALDGLLASKQTLEEVFEEVDANCRKETRDLYESEGMADVLGDGGIPESLQVWLTESKDKILGRHGHREKAWKRLWAQAERSEHLLARHQTTVPVTVPAVAEDGDAQSLGISQSKLKSNSNSQLQAQTQTQTQAPSPKIPRKLGAPAVCLRNMAQSFVLFAKSDRAEKEKQFARLVLVWQKGRDKHERLLRPRLGSPDVADELAELDNIELQRSAELVENVTRFRTSLVRSQVQLMKQFFGDIALAATGLVVMLDSTTRQETLQVPPDTAVPKKHMTLKKLRKVQRIKEDVALGREDKSKARDWAGLPLQETVTIVKAVEDLVADLGNLPEDTETEAPAEPIVVDKKKAGKKGASGAAAADAVPPPLTEPPSLVTAVWQKRVVESSVVRGLVSSGHRVLMLERDASVAKYAEYLHKCFSETRERYDLILQQELSWNERWKRQVGMLRSGNV